jgi:hypothetical protein
MEVSYLCLACGIVIQTSPDGSEWFLWVPTGVGILLALCPIIYVISRSDSLAAAGLTKPKQVISGKGFRLEISTLSLLVLSGVILTLSGVGFKTYSEVQEVSKLKTDKTRLESDVAGLKDAMEKAKTISVQMILKLPATITTKLDDLPPRDRWRCRYSLGESGYVEGQITEGVNDAEVGCRIAGVGHDAVLNVKVESFDKKGELRSLGHSENVRVLEPPVDLHE